MSRLILTGIPFAAFAILLGACLPRPKTACRTSDDCVRNRVCVAGTCQAPGLDAGLDASPDQPAWEDRATDLVEVPSLDLPVEREEPRDHLGPVTDRPLEYSADTTSDAPGTLTFATEPDAAPDGPSSGSDTAADASGSDSIDRFGYDSLATFDSSVSLGSILDGPPPYDTPILPSDASDCRVGDALMEVGDSAVRAPDLPPDTPSGMAVDAPLGEPDTSGSDVQDTTRPLDSLADGISPPVADAPVLPSWEEFRSLCPLEPWPDGRFIVDGDLAFDEAGLRQYYDAWFAHQSVPPETLPPMGATGRWPSARDSSLVYCISHDFDYNFSAVETAMRAATATWSNQVGVTYTYLPEENPTCTAGNLNVTFDVRPVTGAGYAAVSFFPDSPRAQRSLLIDKSLFLAQTGGPSLNGVLIHQLGHTLGFQHEYLWLDPACKTEDSRLAVRMANHDGHSVMHLPTCRPSELGGESPTNADFAGAMSIYGPSAVLIGIMEPL